MSKKATFGLNENIASACCYAGCFISGVIFLIAEKENKTVKFNALQSTVWFGILSVVSALVNILLGWIPLIGSLASAAVGLILLVSWLYLMFNAYKGIEFRIPILGDIVYSTINH